MIYVRSLIFNIIGYGTLALGCVITSIVGLFSPKTTVNMWNKVFMPIILWNLKVICGLKIEVRGAENIQKQGAIYASKHQSALETYCMSTIVDRAVFILKKELTYIPIFGWAQYFYGMIAVDRSAGGAAMKKMLRDAKERIADKRPIIIFPEGTRTRPGLTTEYKPGLVFITQNINVPVIPVALNTGLFWGKKAFLRRPGKVIIEFMSPMPQNMEKREFMQELQKRIEVKCAELNEETIKNYPDTKNILTPYKRKG